MLSETFIEEFAAEWIASWNSHDIERILAHYEEAFELSSRTKFAASFAIEEFPRT